ncbi:hypothetical protein A1OU_10750 [Enterovibrio norvegicus]|nr:hypothetical protein A1OU_10750 [Enterovibrio norvegicus]
MRVDRSGKGFVSFDQNLKSPAACINHHPNSLSFDVKTDAGKDILSLIYPHKLKRLEYGHGVKMPVKSGQILLNLGIMVGYIEIKI